MASGRSGQSGPRVPYSSEHQMPASVQAVLEFNYPKDLVLSIFHQLSTGAAVHDQTEGRSDDTGGASVGVLVTAALLMMKVDAVLGIAPASDSERSTPRGHSPPFPTQSGAGRQRAEDGMESDGPDQTQLPPSSASLPHTPDSSPGPLHPAAANNRNTSGATGDSTATSSSSSTAGVAASNGAARNTSVAAGTGTPASSASNPASGDAIPTPAMSGQPSVASPASPSEAVPPPPHRQTPESPETSTGPTSTAFTPAAERARERKRQLSRLRALREENARLKARQLCRQCRTSPVELTFLPCGHFLLCHTCGSSCDTCPACKKTVLADVKTFLC